MNLIVPFSSTSHSGTNFSSAQGPSRVRLEDQVSIQDCSNVAAQAQSLPV